MKALRTQAKSSSVAKLGRLVGRKNGGRAPEPDVDDKAIKAKRKPETAGPVEGSPAKSRLDRPGRRMKKADGGWAGEGDSGKKLREQSIEVGREASRNSLKSAVPIGTGLGLMAGLAGSLSKAGRAGRILGAGLTAAGVPSAVKMFKAEAKEGALKEEADKQEGRKSGGRVKK